MLNHLKKSLANLLAPGKERVDMSRVRGVLERLEDRTMLSASRGTMVYNYGPPGAGSQGGAGVQQFGSAAAFAPQQIAQRSVSYNSQPSAYVHDEAPAYRAIQSQPTTQSVFQPPPRMNVGQQWMPGPGGSRVVAAKTSEFSYLYNSEPVTVTRTTYVMTDPYYDHFWAVAVDQVNTNARPPLPPNMPEPGDFDVPKAFKATAGTTQSGVAQSGGTQATADYNNFIRRAIGPDSGTVIQPPDLGFRPYNPSSQINSLLASIASTTSDLPAASQILSRESTTTSVLNAVAREVAFQDFTANLFQPNMLTAYDRASVEDVSRDAARPEVGDGLLHSADNTVTDVVATTSDAVAREREAVDAVLEELHDIDLLSPALESHESPDKIDAHAEAALDELPAGEVDGGMVLLKSTGDANGSGFDLTQVYADQVARFRAPAKMEMSIGMLQAFDVATDEAPLTEPAPQADATTAVKPEVKSEENVPAKREQTSSSKSATIIGATTIAGALVWLNRSGTRPDAKKSTAQKRRAVRR